MFQLHPHLLPLNREKITSFKLVDKLGLPSNAKMRLERWTIGSR